MATDEAVQARMVAISTLLEQSATADRNEPDLFLRGEAHGEVNLGRRIKTAISTRKAEEEQTTDRDIIRTINTIVSVIPSVQDEDDWREGPFVAGYYKGEITLAKKIRQVLNAPA